MSKKRKSEPFIKLMRFMVEHQSWLDLTPAARCVYIEIRRRFNGMNNGEIHLSCREAAKVAKSSKSTASCLFKELIEHGFIKESQKGKFRHRWASTWQLTNEEFMGRQKTDEWVHWQPKKNNAVPVTGL